MKVLHEHQTERNGKRLDIANRQMTKVKVTTQVLQKSRYREPGVEVEFEPLQKKGILTTTSN